MQNLSSTVTELIAQMAHMQAELDSLKQSAQSLPQSEEPTSQAPTAITSTRRKTLKKLGLALLGGAVAATVSQFSVSEAKVIANPTIGTVGSFDYAGAVIIPPGVQAPSGSLITPDVLLGLIASGDPTPLDIGKLPPGNTGVFGNGLCGVYGRGTSYGVYGKGTNYGVYGSGTNCGVYGVSKIGVQGLGQLAGLFTGNSGGGSGDLPSTTTVGVIGSAGTNLSLATIPANYTIGVYGVAPVDGNNYAGYFQGNVNITGSIAKGSGTFKIDHPLDPSNKYLSHSFVESPDMMNIYNGIAILDENGEATMEMPDWFEALNSDFRYQLTCVGQYSPVYIAEKLVDRRFKIAGGQPGQEVSWLVTGIRQDAYAKAYRCPVEEDKPADDKGTYLHPELFGQPEEMAVYPRPAVGAK